MTHTAPPNPHHLPADAKLGGSFLDDVRSRFSSTGAAGRGFDVSGLASAALPFLATAARRAPVGLALVGAAALGLALANPKTRTRILDAGRKGLEAIRR